MHAAMEGEPGPAIERGTPTRSSERGILVVCAANVCRSPAVEFALRRSLARMRDLADVPVSSAGMRAADAGLAACGEVATIDSGDAWQRMVRAHRSRRVTPDDVQRAVLVLAATRELRSSLIAALPSARRKVFTLREAVWLGAGPRSASAPRDGERRSGADRSRDAVAAFRAGIDGMRGLRPPPQSPRRSRWRTERDPFDLPDAHGGRLHAHREVIREGIAAAEQLAALIARPVE